MKLVIFLKRRTIAQDYLMFAGIDHWGKHKNNKLRYIGW